LCSNLHKGKGEKKTKHKTTNVHLLNNKEINNNQEQKMKKNQKRKEEENGEWSDEDDSDEQECVVDTNGEEEPLKNSVLFNKTPAATRHQAEKKRFPARLREHVKGPGPQRYQSSSTSTLFVTSTPSTPDINEVLHSMATALYYHISSGHKVENPTFLEIFSEEIHPITKKSIDLTSVPRVKHISKFITTIFKVEKLPSECAILCLAYIERLISHTNVTLHASNWRRIVLSALILASKVWEDQAVWNVDFLSVFPNVTVHDLKVLEKKLLGYLQYNVNVNGALYAKYYFELRDLAEKDDKRFPLQPLDKQGIERLEQRANYMEQSVKKSKLQKAEMVRSSSSDNLPVRSPKVILS